MILEISISTALLCAFSSVLGNDYLKFKHNRRLVKTMDKEANILRKTILKKVENIKDKFQRNIIINSEIDNYVFKKQFKIRIFTTSKRMQRYLNKYLRIHYYLLQKLKKDLLDPEYYNKLKHNKRDEIVNYIVELDNKYDLIETEKVRNFIYHHEHLLLNYHEEVKALISYCNDGHIFIGLQKHPSPNKKVLNLFY